MSSLTIGAANADLIWFSGWNGSDRQADADIEGRVGYQLEVSGPYLECDHAHAGGNTEIVSGQLPPGMIAYVGSLAFGRIAGTPQERGHYIVRLRYSSYCNGLSIEQTVRFHITGSGQVIQ